MKNQLLNLKMIALMCLMMVLGGANVWAQKAQTIFLETFGDNSGNVIYSSYSGYSASVDMFTSGDAKSNYTGKGKVGKASVNPSAKYEGASGKSACWEQGTANVSSVVLQIINIKIEDFKNLNLSFGAWGQNNNHKVDVSYIIDNGSEKVLSSKTLKANDWTLCSYDIPESGSKLTLIFSHKPTRGWTIRLDDIKVTGTKSGEQDKAFNFSSKSATAVLGQTNEFPTLTNEYGTDVTYSSSNTSVVETFNNGVPQLKGEGTTTITATLSADSKVTASYELTVTKLANTLTIFPAETSSVKAPIQVSLKASIEGSKIYYTTDNTDPTTESNLYSTPFDVTVSGTTVKALAVAEGAENVTAEATYTIKPDQPVFSDVSKTFKDAFDVTLKLPETTDATSKIYYEIGGTATAESKLYEGPITISAEKDGEKVILHAVVVDQYGNVGKEKYCTYTKNTDIVFDFTSDWEGITATAPKNNQTNVGQVVAGKELKVEGVVMTATNGEDSNNNPYFTGLYIKSNAQHLRVYKNGSVTFTAPEGYNLSEVTFVRTSTENFNTADEAYKNSTWTGNAHAVTFTALGTVQVKTATIKLVAAAAVPTYTAQTLKFIAKDGSDYYATYSNDKVTFIPYVYCQPYTIVVSNGNIEKAVIKEESADINGETVNGYFIPANTGVLLYSLAETADYYTVENKTVDALAEGTNMLKPAPANGGVFEATDGYKYYKLAYGDWTNKTQLGFYWGAPEGGKFFVKAGTAYLAVPAGENAAKGFTLNGEATGIEGVNANVENVKAIYNLNGQRVASMAKPGLYIVNGKKVVRK